MGRLSVYLPPFAGDYSGVCSALFDLNCLIVLCDARCCTKNYIDYDEPRWSRDSTTTFCARLTTLEVTLGDERRLIRQTLEAAREQKPDFIAILGSPVPAIVGMDMAGLAKEIEEQSGIRTLGFNTTGFSSYRQGVEMAMLALYRRFADRDVAKQPRTVNILGLTPLDFGAVGNDIALRNALEESGFFVGSVFLMGCDQEQLRKVAGAEVNLVVSVSGLLLAREMERECGIPYVAALPIGREGVRLMKGLLEETIRTGKSRMPDGKRPDEERGLFEEGPEGILLTGDSVMTDSLRAVLRAKGCVRPIATAGFFDSDNDFCRPGDYRLRQESDLIRLLRSGRFTTFTGDPLLAGIPDGGRLKFFPLPHPAVSSHLHWDEVPVFTGKEMDEWVEDVLSDREAVGETTEEGNKKL